LIPAGTGMKYYRNVKVDYDPTVNLKQEEEYDDYPLTTGGLDFPPPIDVPGIEVEEFDDVEDVDEFEMEEEIFDEDELEDVEEIELVEDEDDLI